MDYQAGVAPGNFRRGLTLPMRGLKYGFQGTINAKNLRINSFSPSDREAIAPLALPWCHPCNQVLNIISLQCSTNLRAT